MNTAPCIVKGTRRVLGELGDWFVQLESGGWLFETRWGDQTLDPVASVGRSIHVVEAPAAQCCIPGLKNGCLYEAAVMFMNGTGWSELSPTGTVQMSVDPGGLLSDAKEVLS